MEPHLAQEETSHGTCRSLIEEAITGGLRSLDECRAKTLIAGYGIAVPKGALVYEEDDAVSAANDLDSAVALKVIGPDINHKTDNGLVALNLDGEGAVRAAFRELVGRAGAPPHAVLVEKMLAGPREFMAGMKRDPQYGPVIIFGVGGIFAEAHNDTACVVEPFDDSDVERMLSGIRAHQLLDGVRGLLPVDRQAITAVIRALGAIARDHPEVLEIDLNPLIVEGSTPVAADALVILGSPEAELPDGCGATIPFEQDAVFSPRSIAVVGASDNPFKWGGSILQHVVRGGYKGRVYPVNGRGGEVCGLTAYRSLAEIPDPPDLVMVAVNSEIVESIIDDCVQCHARAAVVVAAGFSEMGEGGASTEAAVVAKAALGGLTLVGPNCNGVFSAPSSLSAVGFLPASPRQGHLSIVSQSGMIGQQILTEASRRGIGVDKYIAVGNEGSTDALDVLAALGDDEQTRAIIVYLEGVKDGGKFMTVMPAVTRRKPVVVVRGGLTECGCRAAASHSGALAGSADVFMAAATQCGCLVRFDPDEGLDLALALARLPIPKGSQVGVLTLGGGWGVLTADELVRCGLSLPPLPRDVLSRLSELLPSYWSHENPVDLVSSGSPSIVQSALRLLAEAADIDAIILLTGLTGSGGDFEAARALLPAHHRENIDLLDEVGCLIDRVGKPIVCVPLDSTSLAVKSRQDGVTPVLLPSPVRAARAVSGLVQYAAFVHREASLGRRLR